MSVGWVMAALSADRLVDVLLAPFVVLSTMATFWSGFLATAGLVSTRRWRELGDLVNFGLAVGFIVGAPFAAFATVADLSSLG